MQTQPILSVPIPSSSDLAHLHFIPKSPENDTAMVTDGINTGTGQYLVVGTVQFDTRESHGFRILQNINDQTRHLFAQNITDCPPASERERNFRQYQEVENAS
jgi:hypothetical protein